MAWPIKLRHIGKASLGEKIESSLLYELPLLPKKRSHFFSFSFFTLCISNRHPPSPRLLLSWLDLHKHPGEKDDLVLVVSFNNFIGVWVDVNEGLESFLR
ncbi:hypothetical protein CFOL_v3_21694 [Cephalotus follicularis]|uniref:Uncharacterized protein n=1 Tax=Cephalotus follicularis TaxID=3775 RepID=A0A1Q3CDA4_CEPFO|nr:hypothetical protein CFOL_v3_21694 [Cephalotus follicularis]